PFLSATGRKTTAPARNCDLKANPRSATPNCLPSSSVREAETKPQLACRAGFYRLPEITCIHWAECRFRNSRNSKVLAKPKPSSLQRLSNSAGVAANPNLQIANG